MTRAQATVAACALRRAGLTVNDIAAFLFAAIKMWSRAGSLRIRPSVTHGLSVASRTHAYLRAERCMEVALW